MAGKLSRIRGGRRVLTEEEARARGALALPAGALPPDLHKITPSDLEHVVPAGMVHKTRRTCSQCEASFVETIIAPLGEAPRPRDPVERPDLCANCYERLRRYPLVTSGRWRRRPDVPRRV